MQRRPDTLRLIAKPVPVLPVAQLVRGKPIEEVAELLPRLFNLCRAAQRAAVRAVLGLPVTAEDLRAVRDEIQREHQMRLGVILPLAFGLPAQTSVSRFPDSPDGFDAFLRGDDPLAELLRRVRTMFGPGQAVATGLASLGARTAFRAGPLENSVAARVSDDPVMRHIEDRFGRGPQWRMAARGVELRRLSDGWQPRITRTDQGILAPAARGTYALAAKIRDNRVETFHRATPTDHMLAMGGILQASLDTLPDHAHADQLLAILDPCSPVELTKMAKVTEVTEVANHA